ncbi:hypothetical protein FRB98_005373 [Tulasnella sp. 332]|nr:hypothetical protein FRB98_005373 [Tulasnella sp. 332]
MEADAAGKGKAKATLKRKTPSLDGDEGDSDNAVPTKAAKKAKALPEKQQSLADFFGGGGKDKPASTAKAPTGRKPSTFTKKKAASDEDEKPVRQKASVTMARKVSAAKAKKPSSDDEDEDSAPVMKKRPLPAPAPKKKPALPSDDDDIEISEPVAPQRNGPRRAAATVKKTYADVTSGSGTEGQDTDVFDIEDDD